MTQTEEQKIRSRLRSYERKLQKEKKEYGFYRDGEGKRAGNAFILWYLSQSFSRLHSLQRLGSKRT